MKLLFILTFIGYIKCAIIHYLNRKDSCSSIIDDYNIIISDFDLIYPNIDCNNLQIYEKIEIVNNNSLIISSDSLDSINSFFGIKTNCNGKYYDHTYNYFQSVIKNNKKYKHYIKKGETCYDIMIKYNLFIDTFFEINPKIDCYNLKENDEINIITYKTHIISNSLGYILNIYIKDKYNLTINSFRDIENY